LPKEKAARRVYRLPTEAEWEYACRGGVSSSQPFHYGDSLSSKQANFDGNYPYGRAKQGDFLERTAKVGSYRPNGFGLYDMHGNVCEWCSDWYGKDYYANSPKVAPAGPPKGSGRVMRGGDWNSLGRYCRVTFRMKYPQTTRLPNIGVRVALVLSAKDE